MRYAVVSDIHANLQAWRAVLLDIRSLKIDKIICLGDIVGYGPNPAEVLQSAHQHVDHFVLGNHDAVICGKMDADLFNESAQAAIQWTREQVGDNAVAFLRDLPLSLAGPGCRFAHGDFYQPASFRYIIEPADALPSWQHVDEPLLFVGHSHLPAIFVLGRSGEPHVVRPQPFKIERHKRFLVNVGSVGQPRDREARASYVIFDAAERSVYWRRIAFDLDGYREALADSGMPVQESAFLRYDPQLEHKPLRELLDFAPPRDGGKAVSDTVEVETLTVLQRRVIKWKATAAAILGLGLVATGATVGVWWRHRPQPVMAGPRLARTIVAAEMAADTPLLPSLSETAAVGTLAENWRVELADRRKQHAAFQEGWHSEPVAALSSSDPELDLVLRSYPIRVAAGQELRMEGVFLKRDGFQGSVACVLEMHVGGETRETVVNPSLRRKGGWFKAQRTVTLPAGVESCYLLVRGRFRGEVFVRDVYLTRTE